MRCRECSNQIPKDREATGNITCSQECHDKLVVVWEKTFGMDRILVDGVTGKKYRVPIRRIIERGIKYEELSQFPEAAS